MGRGFERTEMSEAQEVGKYKGKFLLEEPPLMVQPTLAQMLGYNEAAFMQLVHYLSKNPYFDKYLSVGVETKIHQSRIWVKIPPKILLHRRTGRLKWMSESTLKRTIASCKGQRILLTDDLNEDKRDNTNWYAIVTEELDRQEEFHLTTLDDQDADPPQGHFDTATGSHPQNGTRQCQNDPVGSVKMDVRTQGHFDTVHGVKMTLSVQGRTKTTTKYKKQQQNSSANALDVVVENASHSSTQIPDTSLQNFESNSAATSSAATSPNNSGGAAQGGRRRWLEGQIAKGLYDIGVRPKALCQAMAQGTHRAPASGIIPRSVVRRQLKWWKYRDESKPKFLEDQKARGKATTFGGTLRRCIEEDRAAPADWEAELRRRQAKLRSQAAARQATQRQAEQARRAQDDKQRENETSNAAAAALDAEFSKLPVGEQGAIDMIVGSRLGNKSKASPGWQAMRRAVLQERKAHQAEIAADESALAETEQEVLANKSPEEQAEFRRRKLLGNDSELLSFIGTLANGELERVNDRTRDYAKGIAQELKPTDKAWASIQRSVVRKMIEGGEIDVAA
jgi:hypothetical protein